MRHPRMLWSALCLALAFPLAAAQATDEHGARRAAIAQAASEADEADRTGPVPLTFDAVDGGLLAFGPGYAARVGADGFRFQVLGGEHELHLALESASRGGAPWRPPSSVLAPVAPTAIDPGAVVHHGALLEERYELRTDGVEQSFLLHALPEGAGELVIRVQATTALAAVPGSYGEDGVAFRAGATTYLRVGGVTAIDAHGRRCAGRLAWDGVALELRVPASFVEYAELPLLVDPLVWAEILVEDSATEGDVSYDATTGVYLVVFEGLGFESGIWGVRYDSAGNRLGDRFLIDGSLGASRPRVANINASNRFLVVYDNQGLSCSVLARAIDADDGAVSATTTIYQVSVCSPMYPDVGGDPLPPFANGLVVWRDSATDETLAQLVTCLSGGPPIVQGSYLTISAFPHENGVQVTDSNGPSGHWLIVWERFYDSPPPGDNDVLGLLVDYNGTICGAPATLLGVIGDGESRPKAAGNGDSFAVVAKHYSGPGDEWVESVCVARTGTCGLAPGVAIKLDEDSHAPYPTVSIADGGFLVAWQTDEDTIEAVRIGAEDCSACGPTTVVSPNGKSSSLFPVRMGAASRFASDFTAIGDDQVMLVWDHHVNPRELRAALVSAHGGGVTDLGGGCGAGKLSSVGAPVPGNLDFGLLIEGAPPYSGFAFMLLTPDTITYPFGSCLMINPKIVLGQQISTPEYFFPVPLDCDASFSGLTWRTQWVLTGIDLSPIPELPGVGLSNAVEIAFGD